MPRIEHDHPRTRAGWTCPICTGPKDAELVCCWPCFHSSGLKNGDPAAEQMLDDFEAFLESVELSR